MAVTGRGEETRVASEQAGGLAADIVVHRIGGAQVANLHLKPKEQALEPPGISVFLGGTPQEAAAQMRRAFPDPKKYRRLHEQSAIVGSTTVQAVHAAGFDVVPDPTARFPNHARLIHRQGVDGFADDSLEVLSQAFITTTGC